METRGEVFRGDLMACVRHFAAALARRYPRGISGSAKAREPMAQFCGVAEQAINRWLYSPKPKILGEQWFKLCVFLEIQGYRVIEWHALEESKRNYAELIAYGQIDTDDVSKSLGYASTSQLYALLRSSTQSAEKQEKLWDIWQKKRETLEKAKKKAFDKSYIPVDVQPDLGETKSTGHVFTERTIRQAEGVLEVMSGLVKLLKSRPLDALTSDALSEIDPRAIDNIFQLMQLVGEIGSRIHFENAKS